MGSRLVCGGLTALAVVLASAAPARAQFGQCSTQAPAGVTCETLTVPLDRSGAVPGDVHLFVQKKPATQASQGALVTLAGGPGQAATPLLPSFAESLAPALATRDLIVYDERGTGLSDRLTCPRLDSATASGADADAAVQACANSLGPGRAFYTSRDTADDIEAVRQSLGIDKISLYGVSYGTFAAVTYARRYPSHTESLVLDSVVNPGGRDALDRTTFAAFPRVLLDICQTRCKKITTNPVGVFGKLVRRLHAKPLRTTVYGTRGERVKVKIKEGDVKDLLEGADFDPTVRADVPAALTAAHHGDGAPLARLFLREQATSASRAATQIQAQTTAKDSSALYFATACEEITFPWSRTDPLGVRPARLTAALAAQPASVFAPFAPSVEAASGTSTPCLGWPDGSPTSPLVGGPLPDVPALLLEGVDDTRTPIPDAQAAAALLPHGTVVTVPETGHSVLGTDLRSCSSTAVRAFFTGAAVTQCARQRRVFPPTPLPATKLATVKPDKGTTGKPGQTVAATKLALEDSVRQATGFVLNGRRIAQGGLRGGYLRGRLTGAVLTLRLSKLVHVPGVTVSGTARVDLASSAAPTAHITVTGSTASHGSLTFAGRGYKGSLDGRSVRSRAVTARVPIARSTLERLRASMRLRVR